LISSKNYVTEKNAARSVKYLKEVRWQLTHVSVFHYLRQSLFWETPQQSCDTPRKNVNLSSAFLNSTRRQSVIIFIAAKSPPPQRTNE